MGLYPMKPELRRVVLGLITVAVSLIAVPLCGQAQNPRVTKGDAQKAVTIIIADKAKTQTYCEI
jgi:hypothetical protein